MKNLSTNWLGRITGRLKRRPGNRRPKRSGGSSSVERLQSRQMLTGTALVVDLNPTGASNPDDFTPIGDVTFFVAEDATNGRELWKTDGTAEGTSLVADINPGSASSNPQVLAELDGTIYFAANDGEHGEELWKSDGTAEGTVLVKDIFEGTGDQFPYADVAKSSFPRDLVEVDGTLFFSAESEDGVELWKSDGTESGTVLVKDIFTGSYPFYYNGIYYGQYSNSSLPSELTNVNGTLFFVAEDDTNGQELWKSDGTTDGTVLVKDLFEGTYPYYYNDRYYGAYANSSGPTSLIMLGDLLVFTADDFERGKELFVSDGTAEGTTLLADIQPGANSSLVEDTQFSLVGDRIYFAADDGSSGIEPWSTDGTVGGTFRVADINPGSASSLSPGAAFADLDNVAVFAATDGANGVELWRSDSTSAGTFLVEDINAGESSGLNLSAEILAIDGAVFFAASDGMTGFEVWTSDGTAEGTELFDDIVFGFSSSNPSNFATVNGEVILAANNGASGQELFLLTDRQEIHATLTIFVDGTEVVVPAGIGQNSGTATSQLTTTSAGTLEIQPFADEALQTTTLGDFFDLWRTAAGDAGNNPDATFSSTNLLGNEVDSENLIHMFVNGELTTDFENYVISESDEIVLVYGDDPVISLNTNLGAIVVELFETETPGTVDNFLNYVNDGDYIDSFFHRSVTNFVIQGGGFTTTSDVFSSTAQFGSVPADAPILNEPGLSNVRGTIAMAKTSDPDSATSQFYVNLADSNAFLDDPSSSGGFTVFGQILDMTTVDDIASVPIDFSNFSPFGELPLTETNDLVVIESIVGTGSLSGSKFFDEDGDGVRDTGEQGVAEVRIFIDDNQNGVFDDDEQSALTDSDGNWQFQITPGICTVVAEVSDGHQQTVPSSSGGLTATVEIGRETSGLSFGEADLAATISVSLSSATDSGVSDSDGLTRFDNSSEALAPQFVVSGVQPDSTVTVFADGIEIGSAVTGSADTSVTVTADDSTSLSDGAIEITATQTVGSVVSALSDTVTINVDSTSPQAITSTASDLAMVGSPFTYDVESPDEGETGLTWSLNNAPVGMTINSSTGLIEWTPDESQAVPQSIVILLSDEAGNATTQALNLTVLDAIPAFPDSYTVNEDFPLSVDIDSGVLINDDASVGTLSAALVSGPTNGTLTFRADGTFDYTPQDDFFGTDTFTYQASVDSMFSNVASVSIDVTGSPDEPVVESDSYSIQEDELLSTSPTTGVLANDSDVDGDLLSVVLVEGPENGTLRLNPDGSFVYEPTGNFFGADSFSYQTTDGSFTSDVVTVSLTIESLNDAPLASVDSYSIEEDGTLSINAADGLLSNDSDVESSSLTASVATQPVVGTVDVAADGSFVYTPDEDFFGTDSFTYTASDGEASSAATTVVITVLDQPDAPSAADDSIQVEADSGTTTITPLTNDSSEPDGDENLVITSVTQGTSGGSTAISSDGKSIGYTPVAGFEGTESFTYTIQDDDGLTDTATVSVDVTGADGVISGFVYVDGDADGVRGTGEDGVPGALIRLTGVTNSGTTISLSTLSSTSGFYEFSDLAPGTYQLTETQPRALLDGIDSTASPSAIVGEDQITNLVLESNGNLTENNFGERGLTASQLSIAWFFASSAEPEVMFREAIAQAEEDAGNTGLADSIRAEADQPNSMPIASGDSFETSINQTLTVTADSGVLSNDSDTDGDDLTALLVSPATEGDVVLNADGSFIYIPETDFVGETTFSYSVDDGTSASNVATVSLTVNAQSANAPVANADSYSVLSSGVLNVDAATGLLQNDTDADGNSLTAAAVDLPANGALSLSSDGSFSYTPNGVFFGTDTFTYQVSDGALNSALATVVIEVSLG